MLRVSEIPCHILIDTPTLKDLLLGKAGDLSKELLRSQKKMQDLARLAQEKFGIEPVHNGEGNSRITEFETIARPSLNHFYFHPNEQHSNE